MAPFTYTMCLILTNFFTLSFVKPVNMLVYTKIIIVVSNEKERLMFLLIEKYQSYKGNYYIARTKHMSYMFSVHSIERVTERSTNIKTMRDLEKPIHRIVRCLTNSYIEKWAIKQKLNNRFIIHDTDINMMYIVVRKLNQYEIITTYNEFWGAYDNTQNTPEIWCSLSQSK